jgi:hypothetical protein
MLKNPIDMLFSRIDFCSGKIEFELPSVRLARAEAAIGSYLEMPFTTSPPLALCQRKYVADTLKNVATIRINRMECCERSVARCVAANCGPAGMKPAETFSLSTGDSGTKNAHL